MDGGLSMLSLGVDWDFCEDGEDRVSGNTGMDWEALPLANGFGAGCLGICVMATGYGAL